MPGKRTKPLDIFPATQDDPKSRRPLRTLIRRLATVRGVAGSGASAGHHRTRRKDRVAPRLQRTQCSPS